MLQRILSLLTLVPAVAAVVAVGVTPPSSHAVPTFEIAAGEEPIRLTAAELGVEPAPNGISVDHATLDATIADIAERFDVTASPTSYDLEDGEVILRQGRHGMAVDRAATKAMLLRAIRGDRHGLELPMEVVEPTAGGDKAIVVRLSEFRLDLYEGSRLVQHYIVGVGALNFPTPPGAYYVRSKAVDPTWWNPGSSWSRSMPRYIGPGPNNPLGTRALRLDRGSLVIHGTPNPSSVGQRSSHGCIRLKKADVEALFEMVPEQTPVFIIP